MTLNQCARKVSGLSRNGPQGRIGNETWRLTYYHNTKFLETLGNYKKRDENWGKSGALPNFCYRTRWYGRRGHSPLEPAKHFHFYLILLSIVNWNWRRPRTYSYGFWSKKRTWGNVHSQSVSSMVSCTIAKENEMDMKYFEEKSRFQLLKIKKSHANCHVFSHPFLFF